MNYRKMIIWLVAVMCMAIPCAVHGESTVSALWARPYIAPMETAGLIPDRLKADNTYSDPITREEFAELIVRYLNRTKPDILAFTEKDSPFTDTQNPSVLTAYGLDIIAGVTPTEFEPNLPISRGEAATMIFRMEAVLSPTTPSVAPSRAFKDEDSIPYWASAAVDSMVISGVFSGYEDGTFRPDAKLTEEQGIKLVSVLADKRKLITLNFEAFPPIRFQFSNTTVIQGDVIGFTVHNPLDGDVPFMKQTLNNDFRFFSTDTGFTGMIPTGYRTPAGTYWIEYGIQGFTPEVQIVTILPRTFRIQNLTVSKSIESSTRTAAANKEFDLYFKPTREVSNPGKYYSDGFMLPVSGRLSTEFGEMRRVNNALTSYRHSGLDIAAPQGTAVLAANRGKVALSMNLILTGNTIVIDHGQGLYSVYFHMSERLVGKDEMVERGADIGKVGSTGFSTGAHLHFTMSYYDTNIEPGYLIFGEAVTKGNYQGLFQ